MNPQKLLLSLILVIKISFVFGCDCKSLGNFASANQLADLVVYGQIIDYQDYDTAYNGQILKRSMLFEITEKWRGIERRDTVIIWGDGGMDCRPYISHFDLGSKWVLALMQFDYRGRKDYEISECGEFYMPVVHQQVKGRMYNGNRKQKSFSLQATKKIVLAPEKHPVYPMRTGRSPATKGLSYDIKLDTLPSCTIGFDSLRKLVNEQIILPPDLLQQGDYYLIHAQVIITKDRKFLYNNTIQNEYRPNIKTRFLEVQIGKILEKILDWQPGCYHGEAVNAQITIPILLAYK